MPSSKPQATEVKRRNGTFIKNPKRENKREPKPPAGKPKMPRSIHGDKIAKEMWKRVIDMLESMHVLTTADLSICESIAINESQMRVALADINERGQIVDGEKGNRVMNPAFRAWSSAMDRRTKLLAELGLTPSARTRLVANTPAPVDPVTEFIARRMERERERN